METPPVTAAAPAAPAAPAADPVAERARLMASAEFRKAAMNPQSAEFQRLTAINAQIAAGIDAETAAQDAQAEQTLRQRETAAAPEATADGDSFDAPASPAEYQLFTDFARQQGLEVDPQAEEGLRHALHAAGVDAGLASIGYTAAIGAAMAKTPEAFDAAQMVAASQTEATLRHRWGSAYPQKVTAAYAEGRALFDKLPEAVRGGKSFDDWVYDRGLANSERFIVRLVARAEARSAKGRK